MSTQPISDIKHQLVLNAPIQKVWDAIATSQGLEAWLMKNTFRPELGAKFTMQSEPRGDFDGTIHCEVVVLDQPNQLAFTWNGGPLRDLLVTIELNELEGKTAFTLTHSGWTSLVKPIRDLLDEGWVKACIPRLKRLTEGE